MQQMCNGNVMPTNVAAAFSHPGPLFGWTCVDGIDIPYVQRDIHKFFPVRIAERKFLSQFVNVVQFNVQHPLLSHYMLENEALALTNCGYGEVFNSHDLLVNLEDFKQFYEEVKEKCTKNCSIKPSVDGGWVQINNTVIPYIVKDDSVMISLAIVRCAAGLLVGRDVPVVYPNEDECRFLNDSCKNAGISFDFTTATELVELVLMSCMSDQRPFVKQLPTGNPFSVAHQVVEESSNAVSWPSDTVSGNAGVGDAQPINISPENTITSLRYPNLPCNQQLSNGSQSAIIQTLNTPSSSQDVSEFKPVPPAAVDASSDRSKLQFPFAASQALIDRYLKLALAGPKSLPPCPNVVVTSTHEVSKSSKQVPIEQWENSGMQQKYEDYQNGSTFTDQLRQKVTDACKKNTQRTANDASKELSRVHDRTPPNILTKHTPQRPPSMIDPAKALHNSATDEDKQMQILQDVQVPLAVIPDVDDLRAGDSLLLRRVQCYGKTITCMVKHNKLYILLEAMNRLYFPMRRLDTVIKAVTESLRVPVMTLTVEEEKDFMKFYKLPAEKLNSNKVIDVDDFVGVYRSLQCMLDNSHLTSRCVDLKKTVQPPPAVNGCLTSSSIPVPVGVPVLNVSNTMLHQSRTVSNYANDQWMGNADRLQNMAQSMYANQIERPAKFVNEMPKTVVPQQNTSEYSSGQKPAKRQRTRVIGDVICIDD